MAWRTFDNYLSAKFDMSQSKILSILDATKTESADFLFPFKVVTLDWLLSVNKFRKLKVDFSDSTISASSFDPDYVKLIEKYDIYFNSFSQNDKFLPAGDIFVTADTDPTTIPVLLVYNNTIYCQIISTITAKAGISKVSGEYNGTENPTGVSGYTQIGDVFVSSYAVVIKTDYLYGTDLGSTANFFNAPFYRRDYNYPMASYNLNITTMFGTIFAKNTNSPNTTYEIVPGQLLGDCCTNTIAPELPQEICKNYSPGNNDCPRYMNNFCKNDNLLTEACYNFCSNSENMCDDSLTAYCGDVQEYKNQNIFAYNKTCSCFLGDDFYKKWRGHVFDDLTPSERSYIEGVLPPFVPNCSYPACAAGDSIPLHNAKCVPDNIQVCINNQTIDVHGDVKDSIIDVNSFINCVQKNAPPGSPTSHPGSPTSPQIKKIIIVVGITVCLLIIIFTGVSVYFLYSKG